jgi:SAM-dependent methyltransferase
MDQEQASRLFLDRAEAFTRGAASLGVPDIGNYYWYHTVELPGGLVTPGLYDYRETLAQFPFPADMRGMRVLDVGSASGYFAFEFARRGATVVSVDLPSFYALDRFPGQDIEQTIAKIGEMIVPKVMESASGGELGGYLKKYTAEQLYFYLIEGPFSLCRKVLGWDIQRCLSTVYDLTEENTGGNFDLVFMGDILVHTLNPLQALAAVAPLCRGTLILAQLMPEGADGKPVFEYIGGDTPESDEVTWWLPNKPALIAILKKLGFQTVGEFGKHRGTLFPTGFEFERTILRASKS